jgi:hypothetical protein
MVAKCIYKHEEKQNLEPLTAETQKETHRESQKRFLLFSCFSLCLCASVVKGFKVLPFSVLSVLSVFSVVKPLPW